MFFRVIKASDFSSCDEGGVQATSGDQLLVELKQKPLFVWPTMLLALISLTAVLSVWILCLNEVLPLWLGCVINIFAYYVMYTPAHEAMHKAVSRSSKVNSILLTVLAQFHSPGNNGEFLRMMHLLHHKYTNDDLDPDHELSAHLKNALWKWFFWDYVYVSFYLKNKNHFPDFRKSRIAVEILLIFVVAMSVAMFFPMEVLFLWLIPTRVMMWLVCFMFMYLPHAPHVVKQSDDAYKATSIREGWSWLLTPLMMNQNHHLVHHLYPTIPFYRYKKAWLAREAFHESQNPVRVRAFSLGREPRASI